MSHQCRLRRRFIRSKTAAHKLIMIKQRLGRQAGAHGWSKHRLYYLGCYWMSDQHVYNTSDVYYSQISLEV